MRYHLSIGYWHTDIQEIMECELQHPSDDARMLPCKGSNSMSCPANSGFPKFFSIRQMTDLPNLPNWPWPMKETINTPSKLLVCMSQICTWAILCGNIWSQICQFLRCAWWKCRYFFNFVLYYGMEWAYVLDLWCVKVFYVYKFELISGARP